jgi:hypothetical protein
MYYIDYEIDQEDFYKLLKPVLKFEGLISNKLEPIHLLLL